MSCKTVMLFFLSFLLISQCSRVQEADLVVFGGKIYTVDKQFNVVNAMAIEGERIVATGTDSAVLSNYSSVKTIDLEGRPVFPGFIDAHCHFYSYGTQLQDANLVGTESFAAVLNRVIRHAHSHPGEWIFGRGWDQNDWTERTYPTKAALDSIFPDRPVFLTRIDGHAALVNQAALDRAGITSATRVDGGELLRNGGELTGVLVDNAVDLVSEVLPELTRAQQIQALTEAQDSCFSVGLTTVDDAGLQRTVIELIDSLHTAGKLSMRIYAMITPTDGNLSHYLKTGPIRKDRLTVASFKFYADGALGSRGACLLSPYQDRPGHFGFLIESPTYYTQMTTQMYESGFQMNTHAIGDSANRFILRTYAQILSRNNDRRWRIEHAQVMHPDDFELFGKYRIIPSVQPTHATSDMYWSDERLGSDRLRSAYAYNNLLDTAGLIAAGSDFPVEDINPLNGFYAAVVRKDLNGYPAGGFQSENSLSRANALRAMTIWAAYANLEEHVKGTLEPGKFADFVILDRDIMKVPGPQLPTTQVLGTFIGGERVYGVEEDH